MKETRNEITNKAFKALEWITLICLMFGVGYFVKDVWYQFTASNTTHKIQVFGSSDFDAVFELFEGDCNSLSGIACIDNSSQPRYILWCYKIKIWSIWIIGDKGTNLF